MKRSVDTIGKLLDDLLDLNRVSQNRIDLDVLLVDIGLPDMSGYDIAARLRADDYKGLLVAMSGYSHEEAREKSIKAGFDFLPR